MRLLVEALTAERLQVFILQRLATFNAGTYDSIRLENSGAGGIKNPPGNAYLGTSHAGLNGTPGTTTNVPDAGSTVALLGVVIAGFGLVRRKLS